MTWNILVFQIAFLTLMLHQQTNVAQRNISDEVILEIPVEVDYLLKELFIYKEDIQSININKYRCKIDFIEDINNINKKYYKYLHLLKNKNFPDLSDIIDTAVVFVNERNISNDFEIILLLGLDHYNDLHFYFISTESHLPNNCFKKIVLNEEMQFIPLEAEYNKKTIHIQFLNPNYDAGIFNAFHTKIRNVNPKFQFSFTFNIPSGSSSIIYRNSTATESGSVYYGAKITGNIGMKLQALYSIKKLNAGFFLQYDNLNYEVTNQIITKVIKGGKTYYNYSTNGNWPEKSIHYGFVGAYNFLVLKKFIVSPTIYSGLYHYPGSPLPFDNILPNDTKEHFKKKYSMGGGLYLKIPVYKNFWFTLGYIYQNNHFDASSYFVDIDKSTYKSRQEFFRIEIGTCISL